MRRERESIITKLDHTGLHTWDKEGSAHCTSLKNLHTHCRTLSKPVAFSPIQKKKLIAQPDKPEKGTKNKS